MLYKLEVYGQRLMGEAKRVGGGTEGKVGGGGG